MARPPKYGSPKELQSKIDEFFLDEDITKSITGLCYYLGFASRQSFYDMEEKEGFTYTIKKARLRIEMYYEELLLSRAIPGAIFALKNLGWSDRQEIDHTSKGERLSPISVTVDKSETAKTLKKLRDGSKAD